MSENYLSNAPTTINLLPKTTLGTQDPNDSPPQIVYTNSKNKTTSKKPLSGSSLHSESKINTYKNNK